MTGEFTVDHAELLGLSCALDESGGRIGAITAPAEVRAIAAAVGSSELACVAEQVGAALAGTLSASAQRVAGLAGAASDTARSYESTDTDRARLIERLG